MFVDSHSPRKGSTIAGLLIVVLVLAGLGFTVYKNTETEFPPNLDAKVKSGRGEIENLKKSLIKSEEKLATLKEHQNKALEVTANERRIRLSEEDKASIEQKKAEVLQELEEQKIAFQEYRQQYREAERAAAVGETIDLSETKGPDYKEVEILGVTATLLKIRSSTGPKGINYTELPQAVQDRFQFSAGEAEEHQKILAAKAKAQRARMAAFEKAQAAKTAEKKEANREARIEFLKAEIKKLKDLAMDKRDLAIDFANQAEQHRRDKVGLSAAKAREDDARSKAYATEALRVENLINQYSEELIRLGN